MEIVNVYKESIPNVKLIGKRYTNADRDETGTFASYWQQCFREGWFDILKQCTSIPGVSDSYLGAMRTTDDNGGFEYWIGVFLAPGTEVPEGFEAVEIPAGDVGVCFTATNKVVSYTAWKPLTQLWRLWLKRAGNFPAGFSSDTIIPALQHPTKRAI